LSRRISYTYLIIVSRKIVPDFNSMCLGQDRVRLPTALAKPIASRIFSKASSSVSPAEIQPSNSGHQTDQSPVSGSASSTTRHFIMLSPLQWLLI
jgi:hypothetical protein